MQHLVPVAKVAIAVSPQHDAQRVGRGREEVLWLGGGGEGVAGGGGRGGGMRCNDKDLPIGSAARCSYAHYKR